MIRGTLFLDKYYFLKRESNIEESEVPFNNEIKQEALNKYFNSVKCLRWSER